MSGKQLLSLLIVVIACLMRPASAAAQNPFGFDSSLNVYTESPYSKLPLKSVQSVTKIDGAVAKTRVCYTFIDGLSQTMEVGLNFRLPDQALLDGFGYYYGRRFIRGKIYTDDQAWKIYTAVTSRGRDPGIMDRPDVQDYHTQIYPVLPGQNLRVIVDIVQLLPVSFGASHFTLPLMQDSAITRSTRVQAVVFVEGVVRSAITTNYARRTSKFSSPTGSVVKLNGRWLPLTDWHMSISLPAAANALTYSRLDNDGNGAFAASLVFPWQMVNPRISSVSGDGASQVLLETPGDRKAGDGLSLTGRYRSAGSLDLTVQSDNHGPVSVRLALGRRWSQDAENPAAKLWADKWIAVLQNIAANADQVIELSKKYTVVSNFTALLAIPPEELARYRRLMAEQAARTNTHAIGGGGGDPFISVRAPRDAKQVVAIFPDGTAKDLDFDSTRSTWTTRFDFPLGTPAGDYVVTIVIVQANGHRTQLIMTYDNLINAPKVDTEKATLAIDGNHQAHVEVSGSDIAIATLVAPWGERERMQFNFGYWAGSITVPANWPAGQTTLSVVCYDGAHNRSEVQVDVLVP